LVSKVPHLMHLLLHLLQSSQDLAWLVSLVIQILVWLVVFTRLFIIVLCYHSLTHPCTLGQDRIGLHRMITPRRMINRRQDIKLLRTLFFSFLMIVDKGGNNWIKASRSIPGGHRSRKNFQCVSSLLVRLVSSAFPVCLFQVGQTSLCNRLDRFVSFRTSVCNISIPSSLNLRKYCNMCYWVFYACLSSLCNPCVMQSISVLLYL
jgi:hypothetical protein